MSSSSKSSEKGMYRIVGEKELGKFLFSGAVSKIFSTPNKSNDALIAQYDKCCTGKRKGPGSNPG